MSDPELQVIADKIHERYANASHYGDGWQDAFIFMLKDLKEIRDD